MRMRPSNIQTLLTIGLVFVELSSTYPARATVSALPSPALPSDHVKACLHLRQNQLHLAAASEPVLMAFRTFIGPRIVAYLNITLVRAYPTNSDEPLFVLFPDSSEYKSVRSTRPSEMGGATHTSEFRQSASQQADARQRQFIQTLLSRDVAVVETLRVIEARTSDAPTCEIELEASVLASPADHVTRNFECTAASCPPSTTLQAP
jgi:hypothetical protein